MDLGTRWNQRLSLHCPSPSEWDRYQQGRVDQDTLDALSRHLQDCTVCLQVVEEQSTAKSGDGRVTPPSPFLSEEHCQRLQQWATGLQIATQGQDVSSGDVPAQHATESHPEHIGRYLVQRVLGTGGFGRVYLADDPLLQRSVAIKVPRRGTFGTIGEMSDFLGEARHAAALDHPGIVSIFDVLTDDNGHAFIVMKYVEGQTLSSMLRNTPPVLAQAVSWMAHIARAVHYAHEQGFVHRDLKPSNVLIDMLEQPHVTDFGLVLDVRAAEAKSFSPGGTPAYMAPEQIQHDVRFIDRRVDVWALGVMLAELTTRQRPFGDVVRAELLHEILSIEPQLPGELDLDLQQIICGCLKKDIQSRTATAHELAEQLETWLRTHRTKLHPRSRNRWLSAALLIVSLLPIGLVIRSMNSVDLPDPPLQNPDQSNTAASTKSSLNQAPASVETPASTDQETAIKARELQAEQAERRALNALYAANMKSAFAAVQHGDASQLKTLLDKLTPAEGQPDVRGMEWHYLRRNLAPPNRMVDFLVWSGMAMRVSPDGQTLALAGPLMLKWLNAKTLAVEASVPSLIEEFRDVAFSPNGTKLAATGHHGQVFVWDVATRKQIHKINAFPKNAWQVEFTPDGERVAAGGDEGTLKVWRVATAELVQTIGGGEGTLMAFSFSPDGKLVAGATNAPHAVSFWEVASGQRLGTWIPKDKNGLASKISSLQFTGNSQRLAVGHNEPALELLDVRDPMQVRSLWKQPLLDRVRWIRFSRDERQLALASNSGEVRVYQLPTTDAEFAQGMARFRAWPAHTRHAMCVEFSANGQELLSSGDDGKLHAWDLRESAMYRPLKLAPQQRHGVTFVPSEWSVETPKDAEPLLLVADDSGVFVRSRDSDEILEVIQDDRSEPAERRVIRNQVVASASGRIAVQRNDGVVEVWLREAAGKAPTTRRELGRFEQPCAVVLSPDGRWLAALQLRNPQVQIHDLSTGQLSQQFIGGWQHSQFTNDSRCLVVSRNSRLIAWNLVRQTADFDAQADVGIMSNLAPQSSGALIATADNRRQIKLWNIPTGELVHTLAGHQHDITTLALSPDGRTVISADTARTLKIWNVATGESLGDLPTTPTPVNHLEFSPDGRMLRLDNSIDEHWWLDLSPVDAAH